MDKKIRLLLILIVVAGLSWGVVFQIKPPKQVVKTQPIAKSAENALQDSTNRNIKTTFASSSNKNIATYVNLASAQKNPDLEYQYYLKAYNEMSKEYLKTKDLKIKLSMIRLASYLSTLSQYKEGDVVIPK